MDKAEWQRLYDEAGSVRELAQLVGLSHAGVAYHLRKHGIPIRNSRARTAPPRLPKAEDADKWRRDYEDAGSVSALARRLGKTPGTVAYHLRKHGVAVQSKGFVSPKSRRRYGADHHNWAGGLVRHSDGYIYEYAPGHPAVAHRPVGRRYVLQHRLVMESLIARYLADGEVVHHVNEVKDDNRPDNLELMDDGAHKTHHKAVARRDGCGRFV